MPRMRWCPILALGLIVLSISASSARATGNSGIWPASAGARTAASSASHPQYAHASSHRPRYVPQEKIRIADGDTFRNGRERVRIIGYDAPEMSQSRRPAAKNRLTQLVRSGTVTMLRRGKDKYGRTLAFVYVDGKNVAETMRAEGFVK